MSKLIDARKSVLQEMLQKISPLAAADPSKLKREAEPETPKGKAAKPQREIPAGIASNKVGAVTQYQFSLEKKSWEYKYNYEGMDEKMIEQRKKRIELKKMFEDKMALEHGMQVENPEHTVLVKADEPVRDSTDSVPVAPKPKLKKAPPPGSLSAMETTEPENFTKLVDRSHRHYDMLRKFCKPMASKVTMEKRLHLLFT